MELIHADSTLSELGYLTEYDQLDAISGLGYQYEDNDFELSIPEAVWSANPIESGHYIYELNSEWGGRVENISHIGTQVKCSGPTWRGMLARKIISPPSGQAYKTITAVEANTAISQLIGTSMGSLFAVSVANSGVTVTGQFRYTNLLGAIHNTLQTYGARLSVSFDGTAVTLAAISSVDYSDTTEFSQDYTAPVQSKIENGKAYNHVIALGSGVLTAREVVELWRLDDGTITGTPQADDENDKQTILDYPNAESTEELTLSATAKLLECAPIQEVNIDLSEIDASLHLGDTVGGADRTTGLSIKKAITQKILTVDKSGQKINYKAGD